MSIDFDSDDSIRSAITGAGDKARAAGGSYQVQFDDGHIMAWTAHPLAGLTGKELSEAIDGIRATWYGRLASKEADARQRRNARKAALGADEAKARDNVDAPMPGTNIILPDSVRSAVDAGMTPAAAPGRASEPRTQVPSSDTSDDPLAYAKQQLTRAMKSWEAAIEQQEALENEIQKHSKAITKWTSMVKALGDDE